jgi:hypothetical protein
MGALSSSRLQRTNTGERMTKREKLKANKKKSVKRKKADINLAALSNLPIEGMLSDMFGDFEGRTPLRKAQEIMYDAWEVSSCAADGRFVA